MQESGSGGDLGQTRFRIWRGLLEFRFLNVLDVEDLNPRSWILKGNVEQSDSTPGSPLLNVEHRRKCVVASILPEAETRTRYLHIWSCLLFFSPNSALPQHRARYATWCGPCKFWPELVGRRDGRYARFGLQ